MNFSNIYQNCTLCPRECKKNRENNEVGVCQVSSKLKIARAALHFWEEPCISGTKGSGAVFFCGCALQCVYCQNTKIAHGHVGKEVDDGRLREILLELQEQGANNINFVTPGQYALHIIKAVEEARNEGLRIPIVYNTSSYEKVDVLKRLEGIVDVYLPDFKYFDPVLAKKYSHAKNYPEVAKKAIAEMVRQQPKQFFYPEGSLPGLAVEKDEIEDNDLIAKGVVVRQLLLPGQLEDAKNILSFLHKTYDDRIYISMMSQFTPLSHVQDYPELNRKVTDEEYEAYLDFAFDLGIEKGFLQEGDVADESFIPHFDGEGV